MRKCVSLFSGGGGLDLGLEAAGFRTILATDIDQHSCTSLEHNKREARKKRKPFLRHSKIFCEDVTKLTGAKILKAAGLRKGDLDLLAGGPPCQAFSVFGRRKGRNDPRGQLVFHYLRLINELQPKVFVFENVYGLLTIEQGAIFNELVERFSQPQPGLKYTLSTHRINAADFGVPQFRDRVFIIGSRNGMMVKEIEALCSNQQDLFSSKYPWRTVADALRNLPPMGRKGIFNHTGRKHSERIKKRYTNMSFGERDHFTRINRLNPHSPSFTIIVGSDAGGGKGHVHPYKAREVTPRESARIQCFPDWWWFSGTSRHPIRQIGNAVPTLMAAAIGREIMGEIFGEKKAPFCKIVDLLDQKHLFTKQELKSLLKLDRVGR